MLPRELLTELLKGWRSSDSRYLLTCGRLDCCCQCIVTVKENKLTFSRLKIIENAVNNPHNPLNSRLLCKVNLEDDSEPLKTCQISLI